MGSGSAEVFLLILAIFFACLTIWTNGIMNFKLKKSKNAFYQKRVIFARVRRSSPHPTIKDWADQGQMALLVRLWVVLVSGLRLRAWEVCFFHHESFGDLTIRPSENPTPFPQPRHLEDVFRGDSSRSGAVFKHGRTENGFTLLSISFQPKSQSSKQPKDIEDVPWENCHALKALQISNLSQQPCTINRSSPALCPNSAPARAIQILSPSPELTAATSKIWSAISKSPWQFPSLELSLSNHLCF